MTDAFRTTIGSVRMKDGMQNFEARLGIGTDNQMSATRYGMVPLTRNRAELDNMYRGAWIVRQAVGVVADDMTRAGVEIQSPDQDAVTQIQNALRRLNVWSSITQGVKWGRLYGGALCVMMIDGQKLSEPLRPETVGRNQFRGLLVMDRWMLTPSAETVQELGPDFGKPVYYSVVARSPGDRDLGAIHHTRCVRFEGEDLPFFQRQYEMGWGMSVVEPFYDRLVAFDSTTLGIAQMVYKAHLRIYRMKNLRNSIATGGKAFEGNLAQINMIRRFQSMEGLTLIDSEDEIRGDSYAFAGLPDVLIQMAQQVAGATSIPIVKLFGMSPAGFSTGDADLRNYYDNINLRQERALRHPLEVILEVIHRSEIGVAPADDFSFEFNSLWGLSNQEKSTVASTVATAIIGAESAGIIKKSTALRELKDNSRVTGIFSSITDEDIDEAVEEEKTPDLPQVPGMGMPGLESAAPDDDPTSAISDPEQMGSQDPEPERMGAATARSVSVSRPRLVGL